MPLEHQRIPSLIQKLVAEIVVTRERTTRCQLSRSRANEVDVIQRTRLVSGEVARLGTKKYQLFVPDNRHRRCVRRVNRENVAGCYSLNSSRRNCGNLARQT